MPNFLHFCVVNYTFFCYATQNLSPYKRDLISLDQATFNNYSEDFTQHPGIKSLEYVRPDKSLEQIIKNSELREKEKLPDIDLYISKDTAQKELEKTDIWKNSPALQRAFDIADEAHSGQLRRNGLNHFEGHILPMVMYRLEIADKIGEPASANILINYLFHDLVEDHGDKYSFEGLETELNQISPDEDTSLDIAKAMTKDEKEEEGLINRLKERGMEDKIAEHYGKKIYIRRYSKSIFNHSNAEVNRAKCIDRLQNKFTDIRNIEEHAKEFLTIENIDPEDNKKRAKILTDIYMYLVESDTMHPMFEKEGKWLMTKYINYNDKIADYYNSIVKKITTLNNMRDSMDLADSVYYNEKMYWRMHDLVVKIQNYVKSRSDKFPKNTRGVIATDLKYYKDRRNNRTISSQ